MALPEVAISVEQLRELYAKKLLKKEAQLQLGLARARRELREAEEGEVAMAYQCKKCGDTKFYVLVNEEREYLYSTDTDSWEEEEPLSIEMLKITCANCELAIDKEVAKTWPLPRVPKCPVSP